MKYSKIKVLAGSTLSVMVGCGVNVAAVESVEPLVLNQHLAEGWELIQIVTHASVAKDCTVMATVIGWPAGRGKKSGRGTKKAAPKKR